MIYIVHDDNGRPLVWSTQLDELDASLVQGNNLLRYDGDLSSHMFYVSGDNVIELPPPPAMNQAFDFEAKQWVDIRDDQELYEAEEREIRQQRGTLLAASDWTQVPDAPVDQAAWAVYRQALRDITLQEGFPFDITWPVPPS